MEPRDPQGLGGDQERQRTVHLAPRRRVRPVRGERNVGGSADGGGEQEQLLVVGEKGRRGLNGRKEVTDINRDFAKQIMTSEVTNCEFPSPFPDDVRSNSAGEA